MNNKSNFTDVNAYMENFRAQISNSVQVMWDNHSTWKITATCYDFNGKPYRLRMITHNEEDSTGIFDGEKYNPFCGFDSMEELETVAKECEMTVETFQKHAWSDTANEDNYEPVDQWKERITNKIWDHYERLFFQLEEEFKSINE